MKSLALLLALIFSSQAIAFPPVGASGQGQTSNLYPTVNKAPNSQITNLGSGAALIETGNTNILANPGFEHSSVGSSWTLTTGSTARETTVKIEGEASIKLTLSAQTLEFYQTFTRYEAQFADGVQGLASVRVKTSVSGIFVCPRQNSASVLTNCASVDNSNKWGLYSVPFVLGATNNGIVLVSGTMTAGLVTVGNVTGDIYVDDAYVGTTTGINSSAIITPWAAYTPTISGFSATVPTAISFYWRQNGSSIEVEGTFTSATVQASLASVTLPNSYTIDSAKIPIANTTANPGHMVGGWSVPGASNRGDIVTATGTSTSIVYFGINFTSAAHLTPANGSSVGVNTTHTSVAFKVPISQLASSTQVFASQCGAGCEANFTFDVSSAGVVSGENVDAINGNCAITSTSIYTCTLNTTLTSKMNCSVAIGAGQTDASLAGYNKGTSTTSALAFYTQNSSTGAALARAFTVDCSKTGADYQSSRTIVGSFAVPQDEITVDSGNGHGSTNTKIRRWSNTRKSTGSCITYADSSTLGGSFTIGANNCAGNYSITVCDRATASDETLTITVNDSALTTSANVPTTYAQGRRAGTKTVSTQPGCVSWTGYLSAGDVVREHTDGNANGGDANVMTTIKKVSL
jgi:hypothetical protein